MTQDHIDNFDEDVIHVYVPEFAKDATDEEKLWLTFCYSLASQGGFNTKYEFYTSDFLKVCNKSRTAHVINTFNEMNEKFGKFIYHVPTGDLGYSAFFFTKQAPVDLIGWYVKRPLHQRVWIHLFNQIWKYDGFNFDIFSRVGEAPGKRWTHWTELGHGWFRTEKALNKIKHRLIKDEWVPLYLKKCNKKRKWLKYAG